MTRVAVLIDSLQTGGAQKLLMSFAARSAAHGLELSVINLREGSSSVIYDGIRSAGAQLMTISANSLFDIGRMRWLVRFLREAQIDIVQTHLLYANILGSIAAYLAKVPVVCTLHSTHMERGWRLGLLKRVEDFCLRHMATRIIAVGEKVAGSHRGRYDGRTVDVIPNGIPISQEISTQARDRLRDELSADQTRSIIITVGRFERVKGYEDLVEAFRLLREKGWKAILLMVGTGSLFEAIRSRVEALDLGRSVVLAGERQDVPQLLASSDVFASSSHREGLPLSVLEAMMAGLPIVATAVGDIPNVVTQETGLIVPPHEPAQLAEALELLLKDPSRRRAMGEAARNRALREYSVDVWMKRHVELYNDVIQAQHLQVMS